VLGIDGLDPALVEQFMRAGKLPNFSALAARGGFARLGTSLPPQSPVAWSNVITGMDPGGHGVFDFIHRDPRTMMPYLSTSTVEPPSRSVRVGNWVFPLWGGGAKLLRHGRAFWEYLDERGVPAVLVRMPANFPPVESGARTLAGMGTPDLAGTYGTFSFYTDDLFVAPGPVNGGRNYAVRVEDHTVRAPLHGPYNTLRKDAPQAAVEMTIHVDPAEPVAKIVLPGRQIILREGEWSDWVRVEFELLPYLARVRGICRFYLKQTHPRFALYVSPVNLDPAEPALPISTPDDYSRDLARAVGSFYTQGIAEDTKALSTGTLNEDEYLAQARIVFDEQAALFRRELAAFRSGLFFFYFSGVDANSHMFWRAADAAHPGHDAQRDTKYAGVLEEWYVQMDGIVGEAMRRLDADTTLIVLSDHGFAPFYRSLNLNTWLLEKGYLALKEGVSRSEAGEYFAGVDWTRTRAYALGLNALYLNVKGRERDGAVEPGPQAEALLAELQRELLALRDPAGGQPVVSRVDRAAQAYRGPHAKDAPDLLIGYSRGYRAGWASVLGGLSADVLEDNTESWSGDHCMDYRVVPGVLVSSRKPRADATLVDIAPTILAEFGIARPETMAGRPVFDAGP
jgi:predicted AlkP superfamily phosphohydrolase/phosphomutase